MGNYFLDTLYDKIYMVFSLKLLKTVDRIPSYVCTADGALTVQVYAVL